MAVVDYKCPNCLSTLEFNPTKQKWDCKYCYSELELNDLIINDIKYKNSGKILKDVDVYSCKNCGAELITDCNTVATFCVYCKSTAIIKSRLVDAYEPDKIIPFFKTKDESIQAFKKLCRQNILTPKEFTNNKNIDEIKGVYIPFWLFDIECAGKVLFDAKKVESWTEGDYKVFQHDYYKLEREGYISFDNIPVDGSLKFDDAIMNSIEPFDYKGLKKFNYGYLSGFYAEKYGLNDRDICSIAVARASSSFLKYLEDDLYEYTSHKIKNQNIDINVSNVQYVLLPVWILNIRYKDKIRTFAMNAQTGKIVGDLPIDKLKTLILFIVIFAIMFVLVVICFYLFGWCL